MYVGWFSSTGYTIQENNEAQLRFEGPTAYGNSLYTRDR